LPDPDTHSDDRREDQLHDRVAEEGPGVGDVVELIGPLLGEPDREVVVDLSHGAFKRVDEKPAHAEHDAEDHRPGRDQKHGCCRGASVG
jgi:hypothetical protein